MVSPNPERNNGRKCSGGVPARTESFFSRFFSASRPCCCRGCALKCSGKNCPSDNKGKQAQPNSLGNASTNCMD